MDNIDFWTWLKNKDKKEQFQPIPLYLPLDLPQEEPVLKPDNSEKDNVDTGYVILDL